jgi:hypothetical protein
LNLDDYLKMAARKDLKRIGKVENTTFPTKRAGIILSARGVLCSNRGNCQLK